MTGQLAVPAGGCPSYPRGCAGLKTSTSIPSELLTKLLTSIYDEHVEHVGKGIRTPSGRLLVCLQSYYSIQSGAAAVHEYGDCTVQHWSQAYTDGGGSLTRAPLNLKNPRQGRHYCGVIGRVL